MASNRIREFTGKYFFLSNFYESKIEIDLVHDLICPSVRKHFMNGMTMECATVEQAYQALKARRHRDFLFVISQSAPKLAKIEGRKIDCRDDWEQIKVSIMEWLLRIKFSNYQLKKKLIATKGLELIEGN